jgi:hypothetical protein
VEEGGAGEVEDDDERTNPEESKKSTTKISDCGFEPEWLEE